MFYFFDSHAWSKKNEPTGQHAGSAILIQFKSFALLKNFIFDVFCENLDENFDFHLIEN